jgi:hypothetical protein
LASRIDSKMQLSLSFWLYFSALSVLSTVIKLCEFSYRKSVQYSQNQHNYLKFLMSVMTSPRLLSLLSMINMLIVWSISICASLPRWVLEFAFQVSISLESKLFGKSNRSNRTQLCGFKKWSSQSGP